MAINLKNANALGLKILESFLWRDAFDARRQRIIVSQSQVNLVKWACLFEQAVCALLAIAMVHSDNRLASMITMGIFHDRPFMGEISIRPGALLQVMPEQGS